MGFIRRLLDRWRVSRTRRRQIRQWRSLGPSGQIAAMAAVFDHYPQLRKQFRRALRAQSTEREK